MSVFNLKQHTGAYTTHIGGAFVGERAVFRGFDIHKDLLGLTWTELNAFGITGKRLTKEQARFFDSVFVMTSYPDARIWNNRIAALGGSTRSTANLSVSGACAISEALIYGRQNEVKAVSFFKRVKGLLDQGCTIPEALEKQLQSQGKFPGYGRPIAAEDERIKPAMKLAEELNVHEGEYVKLAFQIEEHLVKTKNLKMNFGALVSAFGCDFGFSDKEFAQFVFTSFIAGMHPCYIEALQKPAGCIMPLSCADVLYTGKEIRKL